MQKLDTTIASLTKRGHQLTAKLAWRRRGVRQSDQGSAVRDSCRAASRGIGRTIMQRAFVIRPFNKKQDRKGKNA